MTVPTPSEGTYIATQTEICMCESVSINGFPMPHSHTSEVITIYLSNDEAK